jgi:geranylgeranyl diphosphate synthase type I
VQGALTAYGMPLGEAFQLRDDLLGALGDDTLTGKPVGDDLREGKPTALVAQARSAASAAQREKLLKVGDPDLSDDEIGDLQDILIQTGAASAVEQQIDVLRDEAIDAINAAGLVPMATEALVELAHYVTARDH